MPGSYSIHDPLFKTDPDLKRLRPRLIGWAIAFCVTVVVAPLAMGFVSAEASLDPRLRLQVLLALGVVCVIVCIGFVYHVLAIRRSLGRHYRSRMSDPTSAFRD